MQIIYAVLGGNLLETARWQRKQ